QGEGPGRARADARAQAHARPQRHPQPGESSVGADVGWAKSPAVTCASGNEACAILPTRLRGLPGTVNTHACDRVGKGAQRLELVERCVTRLCPPYSLFAIRYSPLANRTATTAARPSCARACPQLSARAPPALAPSPARSAPARRSRCD